MTLSQAGHAVLAAHEKTLLTRAGLRQVDEFVASARPDPRALCDIVDRTRAARATALLIAHG